MSTADQSDLTPIVTKLHAFISSCAKSMALCAETDIQRQMVAKLSAQMGMINSNQIDTHSFEPNPLPVLANLHHVRDMKLAKDFQEIAHFLPWKLSPRTVDQGQHAGIINFGSIFDMGDVSSGLMYVDAKHVYPEHNHLRQEMYFLISGTGQWRYGGHHHYQKLTAGNVIYNHPWNWHGVKAGDAPLLALFVLTPS